MLNNNLFLEKITMNVKEEKAKGLNKKYNVTLAAADFANAVGLELVMLQKL